MIKKTWLFAILIALTSSHSQAGQPVSGDGNVSEANTLIVANSKAWKPFSYIDDSGEAQGLLIDIWKEYARVNRVKVKFILTDWNDSLELVRSGEADVHAGLLWSESREIHFDYLEEIIEIDTQLFFSADHLGMDVEQFLQYGEVGVVSGGYEESFIKQYYPRVKVTAYSNNEIMLKSAFSGELDAFVADFQVANFYLYTSEQPSAFSPVKHLYSAKVRPAVKEGNHKLRIVLETGMNKIPEVDIERIQRKWLHVETVYPKYLFQFVFSLLLGLSLLYILQLRKTVASRTAELRQLNHELQHQASIDSLTGIYNRRHFMASLKESCQMNAEQTSLTLLLFDIDKFKSINDNFGHSVGDHIIKQIAELVASSIPDDSTFARIGGEEFCIYLCNRTAKEANALAKRVQTCVSAGEFTIDGVNHHVSISLGAIYSNSGPLDHQYLINQADHLMYIAKSLGRDAYQFKVL
ncbi:diguanylate cyclase [uncultured Shewanella sp.]|uniref:transporter substrate-binding domain-containing diguanylate cyclase n=1 Tax=Shewanella atlantica TaxID=271099 RepID=UPI00260326A6|nr:diguanylate cyclase [uncultured Shewanella sp.]